MSEAQIAVLIDYENVGLNSIQGLFDQLSDLGRVIVKRAYADWSAAGKQRDQVLELGKTEIWKIPTKFNTTFRHLQYGDDET